MTLSPLQLGTDRDQCVTKEPDSLFEPLEIFADFQRGPTTNDGGKQRMSITRHERRTYPPTQYPQAICR